MTKKEQAYNLIKTDILNRKFPPLTKLVVRTLSEQYNMSSIPVREALNMLERDGLVVNNPYAGFVVSKINFDSTIESTLIRAELESLALRLGMPYLTNESINQLKILQSQAKKFYGNNKIEQYTETNLKFHQFTYSIAPFNITKTMIQDIKESYSGTLSTIFPARTKEALEEHDALIEALEKRDVEMAVHIVLMHKVNFLIGLIEHIKENLMSPIYLEKPFLLNFFSKDVLENMDNRMDLIAKMDMWLFILKQLYPLDINEKIK